MLGDGQVVSTPVLISSAEARPSIRFTLIDPQTVHALDVAAGSKLTRAPLGADVEQRRRFALLMSKLTSTRPHPPVWLRIGSMPPLRWPCKYRINGVAEGEGFEPPVLITRLFSRQLP